MAISPPFVPAHPIVVPPVIYATQEELSHVGLSARSLASVDPAAINDALAMASSIVDSFIQTRYVLPIVQWGKDLALVTSQIAAFYLMKAVGFNPDTAHDQILVMGYKDALAWLRGIRDGESALAPPIQDSRPGPEELGIGFTQRPVW